MLTLPGSSLRLVGVGLLTAFSLLSAWQQEVRYDIRVELDERTHTLTGTEALWYCNNSPDELSFVWIHLYPNAYRDRHTVFGKELEQQHSYGFAFAAEKDRGYIDINRLSSAGVDCRYEVRETEMKVHLPQQLAPGDTIRLEIGFKVKVPAFFSRLGHKKRQYVFSQWYPKMVVYDRTGWHPDGYHVNGEFYGEYGAFDVTITLPKDMAVGATGTMTSDTEKSQVPNPNIQSMTNDQAPMTNDSSVGAEVAWMKCDPQGRWYLKSGGDFLKTLRFHAENVHDFCWVADPKFVLKQEEADSVVISVLVRPEHEKDWTDVPTFARQALAYWGKYYGRYPYRTLTVVDASLAAGGGMEYPNLVVISTKAIPGSRLLEQVVVHEIGHQWFYGLLGSNEMAEPWLDEGMNTFATTRYFEETYGRANNFLDTARIANSPIDANDRYVNRVMWYLAATNRLLKPLLTPAWEFDQPIAYAATAYTQGSWVLHMLRGMVGDSAFDRIMLTYCERFRFRHPTSDDFIDVAREVSGRDLTQFFAQWLGTDRTCDYGLGRITRAPGETRIGLRQLGRIAMPVEVRARFADGTEQTVVRESGDVVFHSQARLTQVTLDPEEKLLETDRWNNHFPRQCEIKPLIDLPSFDRYQFFYGPYLWYNSYNGLQIGPWLMGREFLDFGPVHGRHMWAAGTIYNTKVRRWEAAGFYNTPLSFISNWLRLRANGSWAKPAHSAGAELSYRAGDPLGAPAADFRLGWRYEDLTRAESVGNDPRNWRGGRIGVLEGGIGYEHSAWCWQGKEALYVGLGHRALAGDSDYVKTSLVLEQTWRPLRNFRVHGRVFAGFSAREIPPQEQFYLSGSLKPTGNEPISWSYGTGIEASHNNWHIDGDANLRGYVTESVRGKLAGAVNLSLPFPYVTPFFDIGNVGNSLSAFSTDSLRMDAGVRVTLGPLYADFPVWANRPANGKPLAFRWAVGLSLSGVSLGL